MKPLLLLLFSAFSTLALGVEPFELHDLAKPGSNTAVRLPSARLIGPDPDLLVESEVLMNTSMVASADFSHGSGGWEARINFTPEGQKRFGEITAARVGGRIAIVLNGKVYSAPVIREVITGGSVIISGLVTEEEARLLAVALNGVPKEEPKK